MKGILVRVGIDTTAGGWNAPVDPVTGEFVFVPIPEDRTFRPGCARLYDELVPALEKFHLALPSRLVHGPMHLDPDFEYLTYGDRHPRNLPLKELNPGDFLAFYAGLRPIAWEMTKYRLYEAHPEGKFNSIASTPPRPSEKKLVYAIIGFYLVDNVVCASSVPRRQWAENAHTRREPGEDEVIVRARPGKSGRLSRCIPVGEYRDRSYRVRKDLLDTWGGLNVKDGYIQRSGRLPSFHDPGRFLAWWGEQEIHLERRNW